MEWIICNNKYVVIKTVIKGVETRTNIFKDTEIETEIKLFKLEKEAKKFLMQEKDVLMSQLIEKYDSNNFSNFNLDEYGVLIQKNNILEFVDYEGEIQIKYELKNVREL
jgi:hypothetical protein